MDTMKKMIGNIFVDNGTITEKTLQRALARAEKRKRRLGSVLEDMGVVTGEELAQALAEQYGYRKVDNIADHDYPSALLDLIPGDIAMRHLLFPMKRDGNHLLLALADPTDTKIVKNIAINHDLAITPVIATRADIIVAINKHYFRKVTAQSDKRKTILIADDNVLLWSELSDMLSEQGYKILFAKDGIEAFKLVLAESPQVIITDKEMPNFSGYRLLESLQNLPETKGIPVLLLTGSSDKNEEAEAFRKGFFDYMSKPVNDVTIITRVKRAIKAFEDGNRSLSH